MILPSKHLPQDRALLSIGARILRHLAQPLTVSALWNQMEGTNLEHKKSSASAYDRFVLALDLLFLMGVIDLREGLLVRGKS